MRMVTTPGRIVARGVVCTHVEGRRWRFASLAPWPQRSPAGDPLISLIEAGDHAFAQLSVQLDPPGSELEALRALLGRDDAGEVVPVTLESAVTAVTGIRIILDPDGAARTVATSSGSGYPPYTAVFSLQLTGEDRELVKSAMTGTEHQVEVVYMVDLDGTETRISADLATWMRGDPTTDDNTTPAAAAGTWTAQEDQPC